MPPKRPHVAETEVMLSTTGMAEIAALVGDPTRTAMLVALMDGRALTATELAQVAGVSAQTTSGHLARLTEAGLLAVEQQGRRRYHRLASQAVAGMLEGIMAVASGIEAQRPAPVRTGPRDAAMRRARTCYDHLAGRIAVAIADRMTQRGHVELSADGGALSDDGLAFFRSIGVDLHATDGRTARRRVFCRPCLDWSERRPHIAGAVGAALCAACFTQGWMRRVPGSRAVAITPAGRMALDRTFDLDPATWLDA
jgi:DNA-binding transcriptional ArsR family regulator